MAAPLSVIDLKKSFLSMQIRTLNAPLQPSRDWRENAPVSEEGELKEKVVQEVLQKLNLVLRHHNRAAYSSQVVRHVAEQIYELYWDSGEPDLDVEHDGPATLERGADLKDHNSILQLPDEWPDDGTADDNELERFAEASRYKQLQSRLQALSRQRLAQQRKVAQYKLLQELLEPFRNAQDNVQPNLATRDGELQKELEKLKILMVRAGEKIEGLSRNDLGVTT